MKKIILSALMLMTMACSTAFAGMVGNAFSVEEDMALTVIRNMTGGQRRGFFPVSQTCGNSLAHGQRNAVVAHFVSDMAEKYTEDAHKAGVAGLAKEFGKISDIRLVQATRNYDDNGKYLSDAMVFLGNSSSGKTVVVNIMFVPAGKGFKIAAISIAPLEIHRQ